MKKSILIGISTTAVTIGVAGLAGLASAATVSTSGTSLVDKIATKFNLKAADVQSVFDSNKSEHEAARSAKSKTTLDAAVKAGTITQTQEDQLIAKRAEMKTYMESLKYKTREERRTAMKTKMDEYKQWLAASKIPDSVMKDAHEGFGGRGGHGRGFGGPEGTSMKEDSDAPAK